MNINYLATIDKLKQANLILPTDVYAVGQDTPSSSTVFWGGAIGAALASKNLKNYIISANATEIRVFDIETSSGAYLNTFTPVLLKDIVKMRVNAGFLGKNIQLKCDLFTLNYTFANKFKGYEQKESLAAFLAFLKPKK